MNSKTSETASALTAAESSKAPMAAQTCTVNAFQYADLCVQAEVHPNAVIGDIHTECCGRPVIDYKESPFRKVCEITIEQKIRIHVPIRYSATAKVSGVEIDCCGDCDKNF